MTPARHREPPLGGVAIHGGTGLLMVLDRHVATLLAMTSGGHRHYGLV